jgi:HD superfamily phosphodiesterase
MRYIRARMVRLLVEYFGKDNRRIEHALRVLFHSERLLLDDDSADPEIVIACALLHDVGIKVSEKKLGYNDGSSQEKYGPAAAETLLRSIGFPEKKIKIVKDIIGNHHSPSRYDYPELKIQKDADRIVNDFEEI